LDKIMLISFQVAKRITAWRAAVRQNFRKTADRIAERCGYVPKELAYQDTLTGAFNRRYFDSMLATLHSNAERGVVAGYACIMIDFDKFKSVNDLFGHDVGDQALQHAVRAFQEVTRSMDTLCRLGGEEFVALVPGCQTVEEAAVVAERYRAVLEASTFSFNDSDGRLVTLPITASFGVAVLDPLNREPAANVVKRADIALYKAKGKTPDGKRDDPTETRPRNRVCCECHGIIRVMPKNTHPEGITGGRNKAEEIGLTPALG
jgi:diguanylate cyclase (GGDEF)-like protein